MIIEVERIDPNHLDPDFEFVHATVVFSDGDPIDRVAEVSIRVKKNPNMTLPQIIDAAIDQARVFLQECVSQENSEDP